MKLSHNGKGHKALRYIVENGPATPWEIWDAHYCRHQLSKRRKLAFLMGMMRDRGLLTQAYPRTSYDITGDGLDALACLDRGSDFHAVEAVPTVRIFAEAA